MKRIHEFSLEITITTTENLNYVKLRRFSRYFWLFVCVISVSIIFYFIHTSMFTNEYATTTASTTTITATTSTTNPNEIWNPVIKNNHT